MTKERVYKYIILSIVLSFIGFICSVSNPGRLPLKKIGEIIRVVTFLFQIVLYFTYMKISKRDIIIIIIFLFIYLLKLEKTIIYSLQIFIIINLLKKYNFRKIFKSFEKISIIGLLFIMFNYFLGISSTKVYYGIYDGILKNRNTYGIVTPNILFGIFLCYIIFASLTTNSFKKIIVLLILSTIANNYIVSRNGYYISMVYLFILIIMERLNNFTKKIFLFNLIIFQFLITIGLIFFKYILKNAQIYNLINLKLSNRLDLFNLFLEKVEGASFLGISIINFRFPLDNSYLMIFKNFGIIGIILINILLIFAYSRGINLKNQLIYKLILFLSLMGIYYNFEAFLLNGGYLISIGYFLVIFKIMKYKKKKEWRIKSAKDISNNTSLQC